MTTVFHLLFIVTTCAVTVNEACNGSLPWRADREGPLHLADHRFQTLLQCPEHLFCCKNSTLDASPVPLTCSCAPDCDSYGDCCWDAPVAGRTSDFRRYRSSCVAVSTSDGPYQGVYVITGCEALWPQDEVRDGCENAKSYSAAFYSIPATSPRGVTYYNGFCALCSYDIEGVVFWNASSGAQEVPLQLYLPALVQGDPESYLKLCDPGSQYADTCTVTVNREWVRHCETYFAPVRDLSGEPSPAYKNVYCALCNSKPLSALMCAPFSFLRDMPKEVVSRVPVHTRVLTPVIPRDKCSFSHENKCYIPSTEHRFTNTSYLTRSTPGDDAENYALLSSAVSYLNIICIGTSVVCLSLKAVVYAVYKRSRGFSSKCVLCLSSTLLLTYLAYLLGDEFYTFPYVYKAFAVLLHYGNLSTFFWTTVLSYDISKGLSRAKLSRGGRKHLFATYCLVSWCSPACLVVICVTIDFAAPSSPLAPRYGEGKLWMTNALAAILFYWTPMAALAIVNLGLYVRAMIHISCTAKRAAGFEFRSGGEHYGMDLFLKLALIMGATWILCFLSVFVKSVFADVIVMVLYGLQGVYLFFGFKDYRYFVASFRSRKMPAHSATETSVDRTCAGGVGATGSCFV